MASVRIDSGLPEYTDRPEDISKDKWFYLMQKKRAFCTTYIKADCRYLLEFVEDAEIMWEHLEFKSAQDMIENGFRLNPIEVEYALQWLKFKDPEEALPFEKAIVEGKKLGNRGAPKDNKNASKNKNESNKNKPDNVRFVSKYGNNKNYLQARLERDAPEILKQLQDGEFKSVRQAAIAAGIAKPPKTPLEIIVANLEKINEEGIQELEPVFEKYFAEKTPLEQIKSLLPKLNGDELVESFEMHKAIMETQE